MSSVRSPVEMDQLGRYYDVAFRPAPSLAELRDAPDAGTDALVKERFARELAAQAAPYWSSGAMTLPAAGPSGAPLPPPAGVNTTIRYSCGATLIAPSYVITAGHCTDDGVMSQLKVHFYRPTLRLVPTFTTTTALSGTWPAFTHGKLTEADGYLVDSYSCEVVRSCHGPGEIGCPDQPSDVALLRCNGRPGDTYGFVNVHAGSPEGKEALMHWKHELLALPSPVPEDVIDHYVVLGNSVAENYHYFDNQLLPLRSISWPDGTPTRFVDATHVDMHGCHGTSGSGFLARVPGTPVYELAGNATYGGSGIHDFLCQHVPDPRGEPTGKGVAALGFAWGNPTTWLSADSAALAADCRSRGPAPRDVSDLPFAAGSHRLSTVYGHLNCQITDAFRGGDVTPARALGPYPEKYVRMLPSSAPQAVSGFAVEAGQDYRIGVNVVPVTPCTTDCGSISFAAGADEVTVPVTRGAASVSGLFRATGTGPVEVRIGGHAHERGIGDFVLIREGQVNSFDVLEDRLEAALYSLSGSEIEAGPLPMRFVGDGTAGFAAFIRPGERMALLRQAIAATRRWTVRLQADGYEDLSCGLLDLQGLPVTTVPCAPLFQLDDSAALPGRLGLYVELAANARTSVVIRSVAVASSAARDTDEDGIPEVLDNCPGDWNASQKECSEEKPVPLPEAGLEGGADEGGTALPEGGAPIAEGGEVLPSSGGAPASGGSSSGGDGSGGSPTASGGQASGGSPAPDPDAALPPASPGEDDGCSCRTASGPRGTTATVVALLLGLALGQRRLGRPGARRSS